MREEVSASYSAGLGRTKESEHEEKCSSVHFFLMVSVGFKELSAVDCDTSIKKSKFACVCVVLFFIKFLLC